MSYRQQEDWEFFADDGPRTLRLGSWGLIEWLPSCAYGLGYVSHWGGRWGWRHGSAAFLRLKVWW